MSENIDLENGELFPEEPVVSGNPNAIIYT